MSLWRVDSSLLSNWGRFLTTILIKNMVFIVRKVNISNEVEFMSLIENLWFEEDKALSTYMHVLLANVVLEIKEKIWYG